MSNLPFVPFGSPLLSASAAKRLSIYVHRHPEKATEHLGSMDGSYSGLFHYWSGIGVIRPEILDLQSRFTVPVTPFFSYIKPNSTVSPHVDGAVGNRRTSIIQPLFPLEDYAPLKFWIEQGLSYSELTVPMSDYPAIIDLQTLHFVENKSDKVRFNFQVSIDLPFHEVVALHSAGKLLRSAPASI